MSATTQIRPPSTSTLPRASHRPLPSSSSSINISSSHPQLASNDTTSVSRQKEEFKLPIARSTTAGGARKVSGKQLGAVSNSSRTTESGNIGSTRGPKRVLQGLQESTSEPRGLRDSSKSTGDTTTLPRSQSSSIRPPTSSRAPLRPATTPLRRSQLSQFISRSTLDEKNDATSSRPSSRDEGNGANSASTSRSRPTSTAPPPRRTISGTPNRKRVVQESTASPRTRRVPPSPSTTTSTSRKPSSSSLLNRSITSSNLTRSTSSRTSLQAADSPLKRSTTTTRLPPSSSTASIRPPRPPLSRLPTSTSTITKLSSTSSSIPQSSSRQLGSNRLQGNETSDRLKGLGPPPVARRVSVSRSNCASSVGNVAIPRSRKKEDKEEESRITRERRESWETVGSSTTRSARPSLEPSIVSPTCEERSNPFSTPSSYSSKQLSPSTSLNPTHLDPTPRQISLLRSSTHKRKPRGSTTLEELLASGLFSSPLPHSLPTSNPGAGGGVGGNSFELMDEEVSRVMLEEIGGVSSPWRGRVVSLNMSTKGRSPRRAQEQETDVSFEPDLEEEEGEEREEERREVLVLERVGEADELRREKIGLEERLRVVEEEKEREVRELREGFENEAKREREEWEREKKEFERNLAELEIPRPGETNQLDLGLLEVTTSYRTVKNSCEGIAASATRERDELIGMMESLKVIGKGLEVWRSMY